MSFTYLETAEDLQWLAETHLANYRGREFPVADGSAHVVFEPSDFEIVVVHGPEYAPSQVQLYARNHIDCVPWMFVADESGDLQFLQQGEPPKKAKVIPK